MSTKFRYFRLAVITACVAVVLILQLRSSYLVEFRKQALNDLWKYDFRHTEYLVSNLVRDRLYEPFRPIHTTVKSFLSAEADVEGFRNWLHTDAAQDSLIGAGFIWNRDADSITVIPLLQDIDEITRQNLKLLLDTDNNPDLVGPPQPTWACFYMDSLRREIGGRIGYQTYQHSYYDEFNTRRDRANATQVVLGIIWNDDYYRQNILPSLTEDISENPMKYGLSSSDGFFGSHFNGVLILDAKRDTVYSLGKIDTQSQVMIWQNIFNGVVNWNNPDYHPMRYLPGWSLMVQDRWDWNYVSSGMIADAAVEALPGWDDGNDDVGEKAMAATNMLVSVLQPLDSHHLAQWIISFIAVIALFLIITSQIESARRQKLFLAHISHELRTPVSKVKLFAETLRNDRAISVEKESEYLDNILHATDNLTALVDNTLNLARLDSGKFSVNIVKQDLRRWLESFYSSQKRMLDESGFTSSLEITANLSSVPFDRNALGIVLRNILDNAIKYSDQVKEVEISAVKSDSKHVIISISDRGLGILDNKRKAIFKRFYRVKPQDREPVNGVGLGLSTVKEIITAHHGKVWCEGRDGGGSVFRVSLPLA